MWVYLRVDEQWQTVTDYVAESETSDTDNSTIFHWVKFTALKNWSIKQVKFFKSSTVGTLKIAQADYAGDQWTEYSINTSDGSWGLSEPFEIEQWKNYVISFKNTSWYYLWINTSLLLPITWTAVRYDYWTLSTTQNQYTDRVWAISGIEVEYMD